MHKYCELESLNLTAVWGKKLNCFCKKLLCNIEAFLKKKNKKTGNQRKAVKY